MPGTSEGESVNVQCDGDLTEIYRLHGGNIECYLDHRIAMSFALAGLRLDGITILDPDCVAKKFPAYWDTLASLGVTTKA